MKNLPAFVIAIFLISGSLFGTSSTVELGHSRADVTQLLGEPIGTLELGSKTMLMYPQGDVTLRGDKVTEMNLMNDAEFVAQQKRKQLEREEWRVQQEKLSTARKQEGEQVKADKLQSLAFIALSAKKRIDYWRSFQLRYPEVDVTEQIVSALEIHQSELAEQETQQRIAALEARVLKAEEALEVAQDENRRLKYQLGNRNYLLTNQSVYDTRSFRNYYPRNRVIINSGGKQSAHHPEQCSDTTQHDHQDHNHWTDESVAERATRILNSAREQ